MATPMFPVQSSQLAYIGYDKDTNELYVTFHNGSTYKYSNVPKEKFEDFKTATSVGKYYLVNIKGEYISTKVN